MQPSTTTPYIQPTLPYLQNSNTPYSQQPLQTQYLDPLYSTYQPQQQPLYQQPYGMEEEKMDTNMMMMNNTGISPSMPEETVTETSLFDIHKKNKNYIEEYQTIFALPFVSLGPFKKK